MAREWNRKAGWTKTIGRGKPLPFTRPDHFDRGRGDFRLVESKTKPGTQYVRLHKFVREEFCCDCCSSYEPEESYTVEVNNYELRSKD
jgi:hypothetical protein